MFYITVVTATTIFLAVTVYPAARAQQGNISLPIAYPATILDTQTCPSRDDLAGIAADINTLLRNEIIPALGCRLNGQEAACPASSCRAIAEQQPQWPSGDYWVTNSSGAAVQVYCDLTGECCGDAGRTRVVKLNMSDPTQTCPEPWRTYQAARSCGRVRLNGSSSVFFPTNGIQYNRVCGRIIGYQYGRP